MLLMKNAQENRNKVKMNAKQCKKFFGNRMKAVVPEEFAPPEMNGSE